MSDEARPIRSEADTQAALAELGRLWGAKSGTAEGDRLDVLATLIDAYESEHEPIDPPDPIEAIEFRMGQQGLTRRDLEPIIGSRARRRSAQSQTRSLDRHDPAPARAARHFRRGLDPPRAQARRVRARCSMD